jgi:hypothetical protein
VSKRALRFSTKDQMPAGMQKLYDQQLQGIKPPQAPAAVASIEPKRNKYGAVVTHVDGIRFDSKREAAYYEQLKLRQAAREVSYFLRQVPIHMPGGTRLVIDFLVFFVDGRAPEYIDVKGRETPAFKIKRREVQHHYPIRVLLA